MQRFLPALLVLILIFGVKPLQFMLILALVVAGLMFECHSHLATHENCTWCRLMRWVGQQAALPEPPKVDDRITL